MMSSYMCAEFGRRFKCDDYDANVDGCFECQFIASRAEASKKLKELVSSAKRVKDIADKSKEIVAELEEDVHTNRK